MCLGDNIGASIDASVLAWGGGTNENMSSLQAAYNDGMKLFAF